MNDDDARSTLNADEREQQSLDNDDDDSDENALISLGSLARPAVSLLPLPANYKFAASERRVISLSIQGAFSFVLLARLTGPLSRMIESSSVCTLRFQDRRMIKTPSRGQSNFV